MAVALGYEISSRISRAAKIRISVHPHGTWGVLGAAIAVGRLKKFDEAKMLELLNVASTMGMATSRQTLLDGATVRNIFTGHAGLMGLMAARLVECGFTGESRQPGHRLRQGAGRRFRALQGDRRASAANGWWRRAISSCIRPGATCTRPSMRLRTCLAACPAGASTLRRSRASRCGPTSSPRCWPELRVTSSFGARFSVPFALATILHHGGSGLAPFEQAAVDNEAIQALARASICRKTSNTPRVIRTSRCAT